MQELKLVEDKQQSQGHTATAGKWQSNNLNLSPLTLDQHVAFIKQMVTKFPIIS